MQEKANNNGSDDFNRLIRQKLENHQMSVDDCCWDDIEYNIISPRKKYLWVRKASAVASVALVLIISFVFFTYNVFDVNNARFFVGVEHLYKIPESRGKLFEKSQSDQIHLGTENISSKEILLSDKRKTVLDENKNEFVQDETVLLSENKSIDENIVDANLNNQYEDTVSLQTTREQEAITNEINKQKQEILVQFQQDDFALPQQRKTEKKWLLAAMFGSGGIMPGVEMHRDYEYFDSQKNNVAFPESPNFQSSIKIEDFDDVNYLPPLSFGLTVRKNISKNIGLETGIVYTYLSTKFKKTGTPRYEAQSELHYLGVPLNAVLHLYNTSSWNIYIVAGGMVEKGLWQDYKQNGYGSGMETSTVNSHIKGLQWSVNSSIGVGYKFHRNWSFYFEPKLSYYFDNKQPVSIRTDKDLILGFNAGLRYEF